MPELFPENSLPAKIFFIVKNQHIMGFGGPVDLQHEVVFRWMKTLSVPEEDFERCFELVNRAYWSMRKTMKEESDSNK